MSRLLCCINWRVYASLGAIALGVLFLAPGVFWGVLPLLIVAACPISMLLMARRMQGGQCATEPDSDAIAAQPTTPMPTRDQQIAELKHRLIGMQAQRDALVAEVNRLEDARVPAVREAEAVARAAAERPEPEA